MVIIYEDAKKAVRALYTLRESLYEDKQLLGILLPIKSFDDVLFLVAQCN